MKVLVTQNYWLEQHPECVQPSDTMAADDRKVLSYLRQKVEATENHALASVATRVALLSLACVFGGNALSQSADAQDLPVQSGSPIDRVEQLSEGSFADRQQATLEMWRVRDRSRQRVQQAAKHPDPEVAGRAQWILRQWKKGSLPGTPPEVSRLLAKNPGPAGIHQLLLEGQFAAATVAVEESVGTVDFDAIQQRVHLNLMQRFPTYIDVAIKHDRLSEFVKFIDTIASTKEVAVTRVQLMLELGMDIDREGLLPATADTWTEAERIRGEALVLLVLGRNDQAIDVARTGSDQKLVHLCCAIAGRWDEALADALPVARAAEPGSAEHARLWSRVLICADRAADSDALHQAIDELRDADLSDSSSARDLRWQALASHGQIDAAIAMLDQYDPQSSALLAASASRTEHIFQILEKPLEAFDFEIDAWIERALDAQAAIFERDAKLTQLAEPVEELLVLVRCLIMVGRDDLAKTIVARLCQSDIKVGTLRLRDHVLESLRLTGRDDWISEFAILGVEKSLSPIAKNIIARTLPEANTGCLELVMEALALTNRGQTARQRLIDTCDLINGDLPIAVDETAFFKKLHDIAVMPGRAAGRRLANRRPAFATPRIRANMSLVKLFLRHGQAEHANAIIQKLAETGDQQAMLLLAEQELDAGSADLAQVLLESLSQSVLTRTAGVWIGTASGDEIAVKSLIGEWAVARRLGDTQRAGQLQKQIRLSLLTPSTRLRFSIAQYLAERAERGLSIEVYRSLLPMTMFGSEDQTGIYEVARNYAVLVENEDTEQASRWYDLAMTEVIQSGNFRPGAYVSIPLYVRRWMLESAIDQGDELAVKEHIARIMKLDPLDIALAESVLPKMRENGMAELADQTLDQIIEKGDQHCRRFPDDATTANNLAWVAAMNNKHLQTALRLSEQAVYREPESAIYRDTLAEILFRLDRPVEALQVEEACLLDDSTQWHLHKQVQKYREAAGS